MHLLLQQTINSNLVTLSPTNLIIKNNHQHRWLMINACCLLNMLMLLLLVPWGLVLFEYTRLTLYCTEHSMWHQFACWLHLDICWWNQPESWIHCSLIVFLSIKHPFYLAHFNNTLNHLYIQSCFLLWPFLQWLTIWPLRSTCGGKLFNSCLRSLSDQLSTGHAGKLHVLRKVCQNNIVTSHC